MRASSMSRPNAFRLSSSQCLWSVSALWSALSLCPLLLPYMKLRNILVLDKAGFTLIEILIVVAIISFLGIMGVIVGVDTYKRYIFRSDLDKVAALLQKARSSAMNNINEQKYGVKFDDPDDLILFRETPGTSYDYKVEKSKTVVYSDTCPSHQVVFDQLTGNADSCEIVITEGNKISTTTINGQGGINY